MKTNQYTNLYIYIREAENCSLNRVGKIIYQNLSTMKKLVLFGTLAILVLVSCKKSSSGSITTANSISATVKPIGSPAFPLSLNQYAYTYSYIDGSNPIDYYFDGGAYDSLNNQLDVDIDSYYKPFSPRKYGAIGDTTSDAYVYYDSVGIKQFYSYTSGNSIVNVTSVGSTIQGTFTGTLYENGTPGGDSVIITNGKFNIAF
jgi:hypothetical protein